MPSIVSQRFEVSRRAASPSGWRWLLLIVAGLAIMTREPPVHAAAGETPQADYNLVQAFNCDPGGSPGACDQMARGISPVIDMYFPGPGDYQLTGSGSYVELTFEHSAVLVPSLSTLTVYLNGALVPGNGSGTGNALRLDSADSSKTTLRFDLPAASLNRDYNVVSLHFYQRFNEQCDDPNNPALVSRVYESTHVHYQYAPGSPFRDRPALDLKDFPYPFFKAGYTRTGKTVFVFPPNPSRAELTAGATIAAGLGHLVGDRQLAIDATTTDKLADGSLAGNDVIAIGTPARNPVVGQIAAGASLTLSADGVSFLQSDGGRAPVDPVAGVLAEAASPFDHDRAALAVSGGSDGALVRAALALSDQAASQLLQGSSAVVADPLELRTFVEQPAAAPAFNHTLADLGVADTTVSGSGTHTVSVVFDAPPPPQAGTTRLSLVVSHSSLLDGNRSGLKVRLNANAVASASLGNANLNRAALDIPLSPRDVRAGLNTLQLEFATFAPVTEATVFCGQTNDADRVWATLWSESSIHIDGGGTSPQPPDLTLYPYPYLYAGSLAGTLLVSTGEPEVIQFGLQAALDLGRKSRGTSFLLGMVQAEALSPADRQHANLIVVGRPSQNPLINEINPQLPLQFGTDANGQLTDATERNRPEVLLASRDQSTLGIDQIIPSPSNPARALLFVSGTAADGVRFGLAGLTRSLPASNVLIARDERKSVSALTLRTSATQRAVSAQQRSATARRVLPGLTALFVAAAIVIAAYWIYAASRRSVEEDE